MSWSLSPRPDGRPWCADRSHHETMHPLPIPAEVRYSNDGGWQQSACLCRLHADEWREWAEAHGAWQGIEVTVSVEPLDGCHPTRS